MARRTGMVALLTLLAMNAFAANSVICRLALDGGTIGPLAFTAVRLAAGAVALIGLVAARGGLRLRGDVTGTAVLALYAAAFSIAYTGLGAGTGALILFGAVQVTMLLAARRRGQRLGRARRLGLVVAMSGLVVLVAPGLHAPPVGPALLMAVAGVAWGVYSLRGGGGDALAITASHFVRALPVAAVLGLAGLLEARPTMPGLALAAISGAVTSGLGYAVWYAALRGLDASRAAVVQLSVPVLAAVGGVLLLAEPVSLRLAVAGSLTLGGVSVALRAAGSSGPARPSPTR